MHPTSQLTENVTGTFAFGCPKVWMNHLLLKYYCKVFHWFKNEFVETNLVKPFTECSVCVTFKHCWI